MHTRVHVARQAVATAAAATAAAAAAATAAASASVGVRASGHSNARPEPRTAASGPGWDEIFISPARASQTSSAEDALIAGHSVVLLQLASRKECSSLRREASSFAADERKQMSESKHALDANHPHAHPEVIRRPATVVLGPEGRRLCDQLLLRGLRKCEELLPAVVPALLGDSAAGSESCFDNPRLTFTGESLVGAPTGEPAINVYTAGGFFTPHRDLQSLTILLPLSDGGDAFAGGGTAFWAAATADGPPAFVLTPPAGTALLFGGMVMHAGMPVDAGERVVFVASFSPAPPLVAAWKALRRALPAGTFDFLRDWPEDWRERRSGESG